MPILKLFGFYLLKAFNMFSVKDSCRMCLKITLGINKKNVDVLVITTLPLQHRGICTGDKRECWRSLWKTEVASIQQGTGKKNETRDPRIV
jgi:hypothetical protein